MSPRVLCKFHVCLYHMHVHVCTCISNINTIFVTNTTTYFLYRNDSDDSLMEMSKEQEATSVTTSKLNFSSKFQLEIIQKVFEKMSSLDFEKRNPVSCSTLKKLINTEINTSDLDLQSSDKLIPMDQIWQDILHNLSKNSDIRDFIYITRSELDHMSQVSVNSSSVMFTCGHYFTQKLFTEEIVMKLNQEMTLGNMPNTGSLLVQYYNRKGFFPMACPKCVVNALVS